MTTVAMTSCNDYITARRAYGRDEKLLYTWPNCILVKLAHLSTLSFPSHALHTCRASSFHSMNSLGNSLGLGARPGFPLSQPHSSLHHTNSLTPGSSMGESLGHHYSTVHIALHHTNSNCYLVPHAKTCVTSSLHHCRYRQWSSLEQCEHLPRTDLPFHWHLPRPFQAAERV